MKPAHVSVVVTCYNSSRWLRGCLDSLLRQSYPRELVEIVAVNDGSQDDTAAILAEYAARESRLRVLEQENRGTAAALTTGAQAARGEVLFFLSHDCYAAPDWLERVMGAFAADPRLGIVRGPIHPARRITVPFYHCTTVYVPSKSYETAAIAYRAEALDAAGRRFAGEFSRRGDDTDMAYRVLACGYRERWEGKPVAFHDVIPLGFWADVRAALVHERIPLLIRRHPLMRRRLRLRFLWGNRYRYLKMAFFHLGLLGALWWLAGAWLLVGIPLVSWWEVGGRSCALIHRLLTLPLQRFLVDLTASYALLYGSLRHRSLVL